MDSAILIKALWITAIAGIGGTGLGGVLAALFRHDSKRTVSLLLSFAGGVMLSVVCFDLILSAIQPDGAAQPLSIWLVVGGILVGYGVVFLLNHLIDKDTTDEVAHTSGHDHPQTADDLDELIHSDHYYAHQQRSGHPQLFVAGLVMACAIALHNLPEGMVIGASFARGENGQLVSGGILMAVIIGLHNIPEGMAVAVPLISGGMSRGKALCITAITGAPTVIGALLGYGLGAVGPLGLCLSLSFASGAMLYVVLGELLPEAILMCRSKWPAFTTLVGILVGLAIIYA